MILATFSSCFLLLLLLLLLLLGGRLLKPIEKNDCSYLFLLFPAAAAAPALATPVAGCDAKNRTTPRSKSPWQ